MKKGTPTTRRNMTVVDHWLWLGFVLLCVGAVLSGCGAAAIDPALAAQQAQSQAEYYSMVATGTAQAPIIHITETGAAFLFLMTENAINASATAAQFTATPSPLPTITQTPTPNATTTAIFNASRAESTQMALTVERAEITNKMQAVVGYAVLFLVMIMAVMFMYVFAKRLALTPNPVDERGKAIPMINVLEGTAWDVERSANGMLSMAASYLKQLPTITAERQDLVVSRAQLVDVSTRVGRPLKRLPEGPNQTPLLGESREVNLNTNFLLPAWDIINGWDGKGIPYYTASGLEVIDIDRFPHISILGGTGTGKSRRFIRPLIACALAGGHRVIIVGKSADYFPFAGHPNATLVKVNKLTEPAHAMRYAQILQGIIAEMNRRDDVLTRERRSTWTHAGRSRTFIVLDELGNALRLMDRESSNQCRTLVEGGVMEGRKVGFNFVIANQRATGMASILSQTGKAIFRVEQDEERAHRSLTGASTLNEGYFMARFGMPKIAAGFEPSDEELQLFLQQRPTAKLEEDEWIDATLVEERVNLPEQPTQPQLPQQEVRTLEAWVNGLDARQLKVIELYQAGGLSNAEIERAVYGYTNGGTAFKVKTLIETYRTFKGIPLENATTTTTTTPHLPQFGAATA